VYSDITDNVYERLIIPFQSSFHFEAKLHGFGIRRAKLLVRSSTLNYLKVKVKLQGSRFPRR
jgi:hypothetical protein